MDKTIAAKIIAAADALRSEIESATVKQLGNYSCYLAKTASDLEDLSKQLKEDLTPKRKKSK